MAPVSFLSSMQISWSTLSTSKEGRLCKLSVRSLWYSTPLLLLSLLSTVHLFSLLYLGSRSSSSSSHQMFSAATVLQPQNLTMVSAIIFSQFLVIQCMLNLVDLTLRSSLPPRKSFSAMEKAGIIRRSLSPWSSPLHKVKKKDGGLRPCGDYL